MSIVRIDHVNIAAEPSILERCRKFYVEVIGLVEGFRPPLSSRGHWLYAGDYAVVHLTETGTEGAGGVSGLLNHYALECDDGAAIIARLDALKVSYEVTRVPSSNRMQVFLHDPAGIGIELSFIT